jgi:site-specific recombinase XerD
LNNNFDPDAAEREELTLNDLSERYIAFARERKRSWDRDVISVNNILNMKIGNEKLGQYYIDDITPEHILKYQTMRKQELDEKFNLRGIAERDRNYATINRELACLKHIFYLAIEGIDENTRAELLGHKKYSLTGTYTHSNWETKVKAVEIIGQICHLVCT